MNPLEIYIKDFLRFEHQAITRRGGLVLRNGRIVNLREESG